MTAWLIDTFIYTGLLIGAVLLLRRPVSRHFGAQVAYALWALPFLRFLMPPIVLPANMAPVEQAEAAQPIMIVLSESTANAAAGAAAVPPPSVGIELIDLLLPIWLGGAAIFLIWRARDYFRMREELLKEARPVGEAGKVRLVETPAVSSPIAFGIGDKVVALPPAFMAHHDIAARDMAIAHELAHHRGHDLVANVAAQPLLALHWFNPLAWWGWRAMRKDQEAACDARVVAGRDRSERAAYAQVIAGFAAGPNLALAAPMACPVLGEKSIIHRLRSLSMSEVPTARRRIGAAAIATTALALPLTASITYAQADAPQVPEPPEAPALPAAPAPPAPPAAPDAPLPPEAPEPPAIETVDPDTAADTEPHQLAHRSEVHTRRQAVRREMARTEQERTEAEMERAHRAREVAMERLEDIDVQIERAMAEAERAVEEAQSHVSLAMANVPQVEMRCSEGGEAVIQREMSDGRQVIMICNARLMEYALMGLRSARQAIASDPGLSESERREILREFDAELSELKAEKFSHATKAAPVMRIRVKATAVAPQPVRAASVRIGTFGPAAALDQAEDCPEERGVAA